MRIPENPPIRDFKAPTAPVWPRVLILIVVLFGLGTFGWTLYTDSALGQCLAKEREIAQFRFGASLKQMMNLDVTEPDRKRFGDMCRLFQAECYHHLDAESRKRCRPL